MNRSTERILTTHTGSLPRPENLVRTMFAKEEGVPVDPAALKARIRSAVAAVVEKQVEAGIDIVNDGEMSKPSYATYIKDRLDGFGGESHPLVYQDLVDFPEFARRVFGDPGRSRRKTPGCNGPIKVRDLTAAETDVSNLKAALAGAGAEEAFLSAASPGRDLAVLSQRSLSDRGSLSLRDRRGDAVGIRDRSPRPALSCRSTARILRWAGTSSTPQLSVAEFRKKARLHIEALNHALRQHPGGPAAACICAGATTKARITATSRCATSSRPCFWRSPTAFPSRRPTRAMRMNGRSLRTLNCPMARC